MSSQIDSFTNAIVRCLVFIELAPYWEDYKNMVFTNTDIERISARVKTVNIELDDEHLRAEIIKFYNCLKTDWNIGISQVLNSIQLIDSGEKLNLHKILSEIVTSKERSNAGIEKALNLITREI
ncbi:hypothetical protein [Microbulbifer epialgicus]|uniref:Uncharacterized protein n=1 Tax=Microbulbifer epialgicus TaxID=393907 RepID=A0ABV4NTS7_9GAMM